MTENTLEVAFLHQRRETSLGHNLSGEGVHGRSLLPRGERHHQLSVPLPMQSHIWWDILSVKNSKWREKKKKQIQNNQKEIPQN